ncbi:MAG: alkaline phosphatase family protein, partial [Myxococcales bacterium]|nr:alkaline phosphatase family protein [Myxococcales bacterium]
APGHTTAGTGLWPGHHGVVGNSFWGRAERAEVNPFSILADPTTALTNPEALWALYERMIAGEGVETLSDAVHRTFGPYDPETGAGAYTAVFNEVTLGGADWTTLDHFGAGDGKLGAQKASLSEYQLADRLALVQLQSLLRQADKPVPTTVQLSFVATDGAGESTGPHSDTVREVLADLDGHLGRIREAYAARGALDDTLFVLVSDHGMARQQPGATGSARAVLRAGVPVRHVGSGQIWFATAELRAERVDATVTVQAVAHDDGRPLVGATLTCAGCEPAEAITDAEGRATLAAPGEATLTLTAPGYPPATLTVP